MKTFKFISILAMILVSINGMAQEISSTEQNFIDSFYTSGKIKVVIAGLAIVLAILIFYLIRIDRKLSRLEKEQKN